MELLKESLGKSSGNNQT